MKKVFSILLVGLLFLTGCSNSKKTDKKVIGIIQWAEHPALDHTRQGLEQGLKDLGVDDQLKIVFKNAQEDNASAMTIVEQFVNDKVDLIYAIATPAAQVAMAGVEGTDIPVIFNAVTDAEAAGLVKTNEKPGGNVTGVSDMAPMDIQLGLIKEMIPNAKKVGVLYNTGETNSLAQIEAIKTMIDKHGMTLETQGVSKADEIALATEMILNKVDAIYIITDNMIAKATSQVVGISNNVKKPVFMAESGQFDLGILATDSISYIELGIQAGNMAKAILIDGKSPADIPVEIAKKTDLIVSKSVAESLGIEIPSTILERADLK